MNLDTLNPQQKQAVMHSDGALLILAGAGSGKTKTLTTRLAYLIQELGIPPSTTLTLTFTNKAANEMRQRALGMLQNSIATPPLLCTFHKFGLLFLKFHIHHLNREPNFVLLDSDDQKKIAKKLNDHIAYNATLNFISNCKNSLISPQEALQSFKTPQEKLLSQAYLKYNEFLEKNNMVDFDDLLLLTYKILESNPNLCEQISAHYQYIMVDEYQDTNLLQVEILKKLCTTHQNICVVGDDDQSIYSWRGADISYILNFKNTFKDSKIIKLETNYRSKKQILQAANKLISHNSKRLGKELISIKGNGKDIKYTAFFDETQEADSIAKEIKSLLNQGIKPQEIAILFRLNALSRSIEEGLNRAKIPYKLIGTIRFYERKEIKDILAYLRLILNPNDDFSLSRIINVPRRGIGKTTESKIFNIAQKHSLSVFESFRKNKLDSILSQSQSENLENLFENLENLKSTLNENLAQFIEDFSKTIDVLENEKLDDIDRRANIEEFYGYFKDYIEKNKESGLEDFLSDLSLSSDLDAPFEESVCCMSVHSSKGLEFEYVFIIGLEEEFFPLIRDDGDMQEERRLGYVAFTRAKERLILSSVNSRFYKGKRTTLEKSRFLYEAEILKNDFISFAESSNSESSDDSFKKGDLVIHKIFGSGVIQEVQGEKLKINFGGNVRLILSGFVTKQ